MKIDTISLILGAVAGYFLAGMMAPKKDPAPIAWSPDISAGIHAAMTGGSNPEMGRPGVNTAS